MPKGTSPDEILEKVEWVRRLPETAWSRGILETADSVGIELEDLAKEKAELDEKIRSRLKVMRLIPARADREAKLMYDASDVAKAKKIPPATEPKDPPLKG
jgi:hypothetical protein